jgi:ribosomal protein L13
VVTTSSACSEKNTVIDGAGNSLGRLKNIA